MEILSHMREKWRSFTFLQVVGGYPRMLLERLISFARRDPFSGLPPIAICIGEGVISLNRMKGGIMKRWKSTATFLALTAVAFAGSGCYTDHHRRAHVRTVYEPAGAERGYYYRDGRYYAPRDERNRQWYRYDGRQHDGHYNIWH